MLWIKNRRKDKFCTMQIKCCHLHASLHPTLVSLPPHLPRPDNLPSWPRDTQPNTAPILAIPTYIPILIDIPALTGPTATVSNPSLGSALGLLLLFFPFLLAQALEFHFAGEERRWGFVEGGNGFCRQGSRYLGG